MYDNLLSIKSICLAKTKVLKINNGERMNSSDIQSEISAISKLVDSNTINQEMVTEIGRLIKEKEKQ